MSALSEDFGDALLLQTLCNKRCSIHRGLLLTKTVFNLESLCIKEFSKNFLLTRTVFRNGFTNPSDVHIVLNADVFAGNVATPRPAAEACRHRHSIIECTGIRPNLRLPDHDAANRRCQCQLMN